MVRSEGRKGQMSKSQLPHAIAKLLSVNTFQILKYQKKKKNVKCKAQFL